jgi:hypothetical protein
VTTIEFIDVCDVDTVHCEPVNLGLISELPYVSPISVNENIRSHNETRVEDSTKTVNEGPCDELNELDQTQPNTIIADSEQHLNEVSANEFHDWPSIWSADMWLEKKSTYSFLMCRAGKLGCNSI